MYTNFYFLVDIVVVCNYKTCCAVGASLTRPMKKLVRSLVKIGESCPETKRHTRVTARGIPFDAQSRG